MRGQLVRLHANGLALKEVVWGRHCYLVPWSDGTVLVGATVEDVGFDVRGTASGVRGLLQAAEDLVPALGDATFGEVRVGLRPAGRSVPVLGPGPDARVVYATGHYRNGILLAPLSAILVADYVLGGTLDPVFSASCQEGGQTP
jgi:glycine oxidase